MNRLMHVSLLILTILCSSVSSAAQNTIATPVTAQATQSQDTIQRAISEYLKVQTGSLPGRSTFSIGSIDPRLTLNACVALEVFLPPGSRLWGNTSVGVRCNAPVAWILYVAVKVNVTGAYVTTARALSAGQPLNEADLALMQGDLTQMPASIITEISQAVGKTLSSPLAGGQAVRSELLRSPTTVLQGQNVRVVSQGRGFSVSAEGKAVSSAGLGQVAQVRMNSGQVVSGIARADGSVEVNF